MTQRDTFEKRLGRITRRHHGARALFDEALNELEAAAQGFDLLEADITNQITRLNEQAREAAAGSAQATRVAKKIRDLIS